MVEIQLGPKGEQCGSVVCFGETLLTPRGLSLQFRQGDIGSVCLSCFFTSLDDADLFFVQIAECLIEIANLALVDGGEIQPRRERHSHQLGLVDRTANLAERRHRDAFAILLLATEFKGLHDNVLLGHCTVVAIAISAVRQHLSLELRIEDVGLCDTQRTPRDRLA